MRFGRLHVKPFLHPSGCILALVLTNLTFAEMPEHWHIGPFFEKDHDDFLAVRPFWADVHTRAVQHAYAHDCDIIWPLGIWRDRTMRSWWRALLLAYGDTCIQDGKTSAAWSANLFPIWYSGSARGKHEGYWALFPIWGSHPHFLFLDDWHFALWPVWHSYTTKGIHSQAVLWPIVSWKEDPRDAFAVWPLGGYSQLRESRHWYALWPILNWASYYEDRDTGGIGSSWMVWPLAGGVRRTRENQFLFLPPFFSYAETPRAKRWRLPWPIVDVEKTSLRSRVSVWPFVELLEGYAIGERDKIEEDTWRGLWMFIENVDLRTDTTREKRFSLFPFWTHETRVRLGKDGRMQETDKFWRIWPFWSSETVRKLTRDGAKDFTSSRILALNPIRHAPEMDRNWASFWTLWRREEKQDGSTHSAWLFDFIFRNE